MLLALARKYLVPLIGYGAAALGFVLLMDAKSDIAREIERCNTKTAQLAADAAREAELAVTAHYQAEIDRLARENEKATRARQIAEDAAELAAARIPEVREIIREVATSDACIDTVVPAGVVERLRD